MDLVKEFREQTRQLECHLGISIVRIAVVVV